MILYHGTNIDFEEILLEKCLPYKDFGQGFYLTEIEEQAERMAIRRSRIEGSPIIQKYIFDEVYLNEVSYKHFEKPDEEWARFVLNNREYRKPPFSHQYDIVIGPVADDGIAYILDRYLEGTFTIEDVARELQFKHLNNQYCFCTLKALSLIKRV